MSDREPAESALVSRRVFVKFDERFDLPWWSGKLHDWLDEVTDRGWSKLRDAFPDAAFRPVFADPGPVEQLSKRARAARRGPARPTPKWRNYVFVDVARDEDIEKALQYVRQWSGVAFVGMHGPFEPASGPVLPTDDDEFPKQKHLRGKIRDYVGDGSGKEGRGVNARYAWRYAGGDGAEIGFADVEGGWARAHPDLPGAAEAPIVFGAQDKKWKAHGTEMLGVVSALDNDQGVVGIAPAARPIVLASISQPIPASGPGGLPTGAAAGLSGGRRLNVPAAIAKATNWLWAGDVLLIEVERHVATVAGGSIKLPAEIDQPTFDVIVEAVDAGIVVVEAAGNGSLTVDAHLASAQGVATPSDSGAIVVGAGYGFEPYEEDAQVNGGERVDCWGWTRDIHTTKRPAPGTFGYGSTDHTSGAAAMIAGVCLAIQGMHRAHDAAGAVMLPEDLRDLLRDEKAGTPWTPAMRLDSSATASELPVRVLPNLRTIAHTLLKLPFPWVREHIYDTGKPFPPLQGLSPDIIVARGPVDDPNQTFGPLSGSDAEQWLGVVTNALREHAVYVRVFNRGLRPASDVEVLLLEVEPATFFSPAIARVVGSTVVSQVPAAHRDPPEPGFAVSPPIAWTPSTDQTTLAAVVGIGGKPPYLPSNSTYSRHARWLRDECRAVATRSIVFVIWRPFEDPYAARPVVSLRFLVGGNVLEERAYRLVLELEMLEGCSVGLVGSGDAVRAMAREDDAVTLLPEPFGGRLELTGGSRVELRPWTSPALARTELQLVIDAEKPPPGDHAIVTVRQLAAEDDREIGRLTWRLVPETGELFGSSLF